MRHLSVPRYRSHVRIDMRVLFARFDQFGLARVFAHVEQKDVGTSESQEVVFETVPFAAHGRKTAVLGLFFVDDAGLGVEGVQGGDVVGLVGGDHLGGVPESEGAVVHAGEDEAGGEHTFVEIDIPYFSPQVSQAMQRKGISVQADPITLIFLALSWRSTSSRSREQIPLSSLREAEARSQEWLLELDQARYPGFWQYLSYIKPFINTYLDLAYQRGLNFQGRKFVKEKRKLWGN